MSNDLYCLEFKTVFMFVRLSYFSCDVLTGNVLRVADRFLAGHDMTCNYLDTILTLPCTRDSRSSMSFSCCCLSSDYRVLPHGKSWKTN